MRWNTWVGVEVDLRERPETRRWCRAIGDPNGDVYLYRLWCWLRKFSPLGELTPDLMQDAAEGVGWPRSGVEFATALEASGVIECGKVVLYEEVNGWILMRGERERRRKRESYERKKDGAPPRGRAAGKPPAVRKIKRRSRKVA